MEYISQWWIFDSTLVDEPSFHFVSKYSGLQLKWTQQSNFIQTL